jgi:hypothetical protein
MYQLFLWRLYLMVMRGATSLLGALEGVGPENRDFFGPWNSTSEASAIWVQKSRNDVAPLKTITYRAIKTTGTLIVNMEGFCIFSIFLSIRRIYTQCKDFLYISNLIPASTFNAKLCVFFMGTDQLRWRYLPFFNTLYPDVRCFRQIA